MGDIMFASTNLRSYTLHHCGKGGGVRRVRRVRGRVGKVRRVRGG